MKLRRSVLVLIAPVLLLVIYIYTRELGLPGLPAASARSVAPSYPWQPVASGIETCTFTWNGKLQPITGHNNLPDIVAVRIDPARTHLRVVDTLPRFGAAGATADQVCPKRGAAINASFFSADHERNPLGLLISNGKRLQRRVPNADWGTFFVTARGARIIKSRDKLPTGVLEAVEAKPRLVVAGECMRFKPQGPSRRSAVAIDGRGRVFLVASDMPLTLEEWAKCLRDGFGCAHALNFDGGPSTQIAVSGSQPHHLPGGWPVPVLLVAE
jgi:uncharacterized protein YigE (DUF2233 family)